MNHTNSLRILFATLTKMYRQGGDVIHISEVLQELVRSGADVTLVASGKPSKSLEGVTVIDAGRVKQRGKLIRLVTFICLTWRTLRHVVRLRRTMDILYTRDAFLGSCCILLRPVIRLPIIFEVNGLRGEETAMTARSLGGRLASFINYQSEKILARRADFLVCVTPGIKNIMARKYKVPPERMRVVPNGVNLKLFTPDIESSRKNELRQSLQLKTDDSVILYLGSLQPWQDLPTVLQAVRNIKIDQGNLVLIIVGDGSQKSKLEEQACHIPKNIRIIFTGNIPYREAPNYISLADICVLPRTREVNAKIGLSPIKLYAYLACGKPIVASEIEGFEFLQQENLGTLVPCGDANAFAAALRDWLNNPRRRQEISPLIRKYAEENCGWEKTARSVFEVCLQVAAPQNKRHD